MVRDLFDTVCRLLKENGDPFLLRKALSDLRAACRNESGLHALLYYLDQEKQEILLQTLDANDAKTRKNAALLLGMLGRQDFLSALCTAYEKEKQLFVRPAYLKAILNLDFRSCMDLFRKRKEELEQGDIDEKNRKHTDEEYHLLTELILLADGSAHHEFCGWNEESDLLLMTNRNHTDVTVRELKEHGIMDAHAVNVGVLLKTDCLRDVCRCRTWQELLFILPFSKKDSMLAANLIPGLATLRCIQPDTDSSTLYEEGTALKAAAHAIVDAGLLRFLEKRHKGRAPFYFRIEWKGRLEVSKKGTLIKRFAAEIERASDYKLLNAAGNYEVELRVIENSKGRFNLLLKLFSIKEDRFLYRKNSVAGSIRPYHAALTAALADSYLLEEAKILDPFCGVGTMLIERHHFKKANTMYGVDLYGTAIEYARENTQAANQIIHYINKDFFDFTHEYLFDEIFTNMPIVTPKQDEQAIEELYRQFFKKAGEHLTDRGVMVLYTHNLSFARKYAREYGFETKDVWEISKRERCFVAVFRSYRKIN